MSVSSTVKPSTILEFCDSYKLELASMNPSLTQEQIAAMTIQVARDKYSSSF